MNNNTATYNKDDDILIPFTASAAVSDALSRLGRTEDIHFSPDRRRLAIAGINKNKILILEIDITSEENTRRITLTDHLEISSDCLNQPHGVTWIDNQNIIVANRGGEAAILQLPDSKPSSRRVKIPALHIIHADEVDLLNTPGSVAVSEIGMSLHEIYICNNFSNYVSRHILDTRNNTVIRGGAILLCDGLEIPDGVTLSHNSQWIAISNHNDNSIFLYENTRELGPHSKPSCILRGVNCPHGLRFSADGQTLLVADAAAPFVYLYKSTNVGWSGECRPVTSFRVMNEECFTRGQYNPQEGGPKGIDIDFHTGVLVVTCEKQPIAFIDTGITAPPCSEVSSSKELTASQAERVRSVLLGQIEAVAQSRALITGRYKDEIRELHTSSSWRVTAPLRRLMNIFRKIHD